MIHCSDSDNTANHSLGIQTIGGIVSKETVCCVVGK